MSVSLSLFKGDLELAVGLSQIRSPRESCLSSSNLAFSASRYKKTSSSLGTWKGDVRAILCGEV